jgi:gamma-glutamylcyclotransferase (GGCT)/AIG2-like uncharacterized protein YtfP
VTRASPPAAGPPRLFAYGSLAPGRPDGHVLADVAGTWEPATLRGDLVQDGWGAARGYPALVLHQDTTHVVSGMPLTSDVLEEAWGTL